MASVNMVIDAAVDAGWVENECVHDAPRHVVFDYPRPLRNGTIGFFARVHMDLAKNPHVTYIGATGTPDRRVSLKAAIEFMQRIAREHPKE
jgi:hypothetical protein